jgi:hypothetical protein
LEDFDLTMGETTWKDGALNPYWGKRKEHFGVADLMYENDFA